MPTDKTSKLMNLDFQKQLVNLGETQLPFFWDLQKNKNKNYIIQKTIFRKISKGHFSFSFRLAAFS